MAVINILAIGDICGEAGISQIEKTLNPFKKQKNIAFCVANGENGDGVGITPSNCDILFAHGVDVITLGNHTWNKRSIVNYLDDNRYILRPANFAPGLPGRGYGIYDLGSCNILVANIIGRFSMSVLSENPFFEIDRILEDPQVRDCTVKLVDFHAEATSEKLAMAHYLDGRVSALWGTHTHVQTSDGSVFKKGMGYITDLGMTGSKDSILGMDPQPALDRFLGKPTERLTAAPPPGKLEGGIFEIDTETGRCLSVEAVRIE